jgi:hypothetical protein
VVCGDSSTSNLKWSPNHPDPAVTTTITTTTARINVLSAKYLGAPCTKLDAEMSGN